MLIAIYCIYIYKYISELKPHWNNFRQPQKSYNSTSTYKKLNFSIYNKKVSSINKPTYITQALHGHIHKLTSWGIPMTADTCELWFGWAGTSSFPGKHLETRKRSGNGHPKRVSRHVHCVGCLFFFWGAQCSATNCVTAAAEYSNQARLGDLQDETQISGCFRVRKFCVFDI